MTLSEYVLFVFNFYKNQFNIKHVYMFVYFCVRVICTFVCKVVVLGGVFALYLWSKKICSSKG